MPYPVPLMCFSCKLPQTFEEGGDSLLVCSICKGPYLIQKLDGELVSPGRQHYMGKKDDKPQPPPHTHNYVDQGNGWYRCSCGAQYHVS